MALTLITWNVQWFCGLDNVVNVERVVAHARAMADFDVLCLQEVADNYPRLEGDAGFDQAQRVQDLLPGFEVHFGAAVDERGPDGRRQRFGNLVATRLPVRQVRHHALPWPSDGGIRSMPRMCTSVTVDSALGPVRLMTTHLEFYSARQRMAQTRALVDLHHEACAHAAQPPLQDASGGPFQSKAHTASAILCGDFNLERHEPEYALLGAEPDAAAPQGASALRDAWPLAHGRRAPAPTFRLHDRRYGPEPISCDYVFVSDDLAPRVRAVEVDTETTVSDHQPVLLRLA
jgi:endonuclease/exonuclease/phosphatase family metal-dependent hydrolase